MQQKQKFRQSGKFYFEMNGQTQNEREELISKESKCARICQYILVTLPIVLALISTVLFSLALLTLNNKQYLHKSSAVRIMSHMHDLLQKQPIMEFRTSKVGVKCDAGFEQADFGQFNGVRSGCLCSDGKVSNASKCIFDSKCTYVTKRKIIKFNIFDGFNMCVRRVKKGDWMKSNKCEKGFSKCEYEICIRNDICPSTKMTYLNTFDPSTPPLYFSSFNKEKGNQYNTIVDLDSSWSKNQLRCLDFTHQTPAKESGLAYPLNIALHQNNCGYFGPATMLVKIASTKTTTFQKANKLDVLLNGLPYYKQLFSSPKDNTYSILTVSRPSFSSNSKCSEDNFIKMDLFSIQQHKKILEIVYGYAIQSLILSIVLMIYGVVFLCKKNNAYTFFSSSTALWTLNILGMLSAISILVFGIIAMWYSQKEDLVTKFQQFQSILTNKCLQQNYIKPAQYIHDYIQSHVIILLPIQTLLFCLSFLYILVILLASTIRCLKSPNPCSPI